MERTAHQPTGHHAAARSGFQAADDGQGERPLMMLDMANTGVARGQIYLACQRRERTPLGWALNAEGAPTTDPDAAINGLILPMAHPKGYAIATVMDVFAGVLSGSRFLSAVHCPYLYDKQNGAGHFVTVYDVEASDIACRHLGELGAHRRRS